MKRQKYIIIITSLLVLNGVILFKLRQNKMVCQKAVTFLKKELVNNEGSKRTEKVYDENLMLENENLKLDENIKLINLEGDTILAKNVFDKKTIVFRYSALNCKDCVDSEINILAKNTLSFSDELCIIAYYDKKRDLFVNYQYLKQKGLKNFEMYLLLDNSLEIPIEKYNIPYYFHIDSRLVMNNFFVPQKEKPKFSEIYLNFASKNFLNQREKE